MGKMKRSLLIFHGLTILQSIGNNLAHPVTPAFINNLALRDSMFGFVRILGNSHCSGVKYPPDTTILSIGLCNTILDRDHRTDRAAFWQDLRFPGSPNELPGITKRPRRGHLTLSIQLSSTVMGWG